MAGAAYFIDWRPVAFLPAHSPPVVSKVKSTKLPMIGTNRLFPDDSLHGLSIDEISFITRDDGLILFCLTFRQDLISTVQSYYEQIHRHLRSPSKSEAFRTFLSNKHFSAIDHSARIEDQLVFPNAEVFLESLTHRSAVLVAQYIKYVLGHVHTFHASIASSSHKPKSWELRQRERIENLFLQVEPIRISPPQFNELVDILHTDNQSKDDPERIAIARACVENPLECLRDDRILVRIKQHRLATRNGAPQREALFELRRIYARMVDDCIRLLPEIKNQHFMARVPLIGLRWPLTYLLFCGLILALFVLCAWILSFSVAPQSWGFLEQYSAVLMFVFGVVAIAGFGHLEFGRRRGKVIDTLQRTAGVLEYGAILSNVVSIAAMNAKVSRYGGEIAADQHGPVRLIDRRRSTEIDKRDLNKLLTGIFVGIFLFFFALAEAHSSLLQILISENSK